MNISFRPHHFLCTLGFQGKGYSPRFVENYRHIVSALQHNDSLPITIAPTNDSICKACPHQNQNACQKEEKIQELDKRHLEILNLKMGDVITWFEAKGRLQKHMTLKAFHRACAGCQWKVLGFCEQALRRLKEENVCEKEAVP